MPQLSRKRPSLVQADSISISLSTLNQIRRVLREVSRGRDFTRSGIKSRDPDSSSAMIVRRWSSGNGTRGAPVQVVLLVCDKSGDDWFDSVAGDSADREDANDEDEDGTDTGKDDMSGVKSCGASSSNGSRASIQSSSQLTTSREVNFGNILSKSSRFILEHWPLYRDSDLICG